MSTKNGVSLPPWASLRSRGSGVRRPGSRPASARREAARAGNRSAAARVRGKHTTRSAPMTTVWNCPWRTDRASGLSPGSRRLSRERCVATMFVSALTPRLGHPHHTRSMSLPRQAELPSTAPTPCPSPDLALRPTSAYASCLERLPAIAELWSQRWLADGIHDRRESPTKAIDTTGTICHIAITAHHFGVVRYARVSVTCASRWTHQIGASRGQPS